MANKITIDPVTRIEGHLKIETKAEKGIIVEAKSTGNLFRGIELILRGRDPRDAQVITQRICGVCPQSHAVTAALNLDNAFGIGAKIPPNARILRNLIQGAHVVQDHILHFYHLAALDYVDITDVAKYEGDNQDLKSVQDFISRGELGPFVPRYEGDYRLPPKVNQEATAHYLKALEIRRIGQEMVSMLSGKIPHSVGIVPGGVTSMPSTDKVTAFMWKLNILKDFVDNVYIPDVLAVAGAYPDYCEIGAGCTNLLSFGGYDLEDGNEDQSTRQRLFRQGTVSADLKHEDLDIAKINEHVKHSWYDDATTGLHPSKGDTVVKYKKSNAYSWLKAPRYDDKVYEVGPLARVANTYAAGDEDMVAMVDGALAQLKAPKEALFSVMGRHLARALCTKHIADSMSKWLLELKPDEPIYTEYELPENAIGYGIVEASRGALGHWVEIREGKIYNYQCVVPTTWNASPRDDKGVPGPIEQAIEGTAVKDKDNPFEIVRIVRSFDPCIACAVH
jgi:hydrogenase large subunit